ncbi:TPA: hypothetical protein EYO57_12465 [Candidatus Poribacteria bacterium]|nr:hypothetical protein [Candidatus Poribacteria bacterium]
MSEPNPTDSEFYSNFLGSSTANVVFAIIFFIAAWVKTRLNKSKCAGHCYCFECESSLAKLEQLEHKLTRTQTDQKQMLKEIVTHIREQKISSESLLRLEDMKEHDV